MLLFILAWIYIFILSIGYGLTVFRLLQKVRIFQIPIGAGSWELVSLAGLCFLSWLLSLVSFISGINFIVHGFLLAGAIVLLLVNRAGLRSIKMELKNGIRHPALFWPLFSVFAFLTLLQASHSPAFPDTGSYHAQFIQWLQQYRVVPGLGNLHGRLAFNSHAHLLAAFFSWPHVEATPLHQSFGSYLFLLAGFFSFRKFCWYFQQRHPAILFYSGFLLLIFICFRPWISSPMPDSAVTIFIFFAVALLVEKINSGTLAKTDFYSGLLLILTATLISFKLSAVFLVALLFYQLFYLAGSERRPRLMAAAGIFFLVLLPWVIRNVILSGYLLYPLPWLDLFNFDWEIPLQKVKWEHLEIVHFARLPNAAWRENIGVPLTGWFGSWFKMQEKVSQGLLILLSGLLLLQGLFLSYRNWKLQPPLYILFLVLSFCCLLWFFTAPAFRFGYGYLIGAALCGSMLFFKGKLPVFSNYVLAGICLLYALNGIRNELKSGVPAKVLIVPEPYRTVITETKKIGETPLLLRPDDGRCWNSPIPCTETLAPGLQLRGNSLREGFRIQRTAQ